MDSVTFRVSGSKISTLSQNRIFRIFSRRDTSISVHLQKNLLSFQHSFVVYINEKDKNDKNVFSQSKHYSQKPPKCLIIQQNNLQGTPITIIGLL